MSTRSFYLFVAAYLGLLLIQPSAHAIESKTLYQTCAACHGAQGEGNPELAAPALAGQFEWYTQHQLENFKNTKGTILILMDFFYYEHKNFESGLMYQKNYMLDNKQFTYIKRIPDSCCAVFRYNGGI